MLVYRVFRVRVRVGVKSRKTHKSVVQVMHLITSPLLLVAKLPGSEIADERLRPRGGEALKRTGVMRE